jgi:glycosyltransferase 2 family protein
LEHSSEIDNNTSTKKLTWSWKWWQFKFFIAGFLLYYLFTSGKLSFSLFHGVFSWSSLARIVIAGSLIILAYLISSWRLYWLFRFQDYSFSPRLCFQINLIGFFFNNFLPASIGGDAMRAYYFAKGREKIAPILATLVYDRVLGLMALVLLAFLGLSLAWLAGQGFVWSREFSWAFLGLGGALAAFVLAFALSRWPRFLGLIETYIARLPLGPAIVRFLDSIANLSKYGVASLALLGLSLGTHLLTALAIYVTGLAFGLKPSLFLTIILSPLIFLSGILPLSPNNIGWTEYLGSLIWASQGLGQGGNLWMAFRVVTVLFSLSGLIIYLRLRAGALSHEG